MSTWESKKECHSCDVSICTIHLQVQGEQKNTPDLVAFNYAASFK